MTDTTINSRTDPEAIEREVMQTQDEIGDTVEELERKLNPRDVTRSVIGDDNADMAEEALEVARTNPIPVALIAIGAIWLLATSRSPVITRLRERITGRSGGDMELRPRSAEPAPIGPPPETGAAFDRRS